MKNEKKSIESFDGTNLVRWEPAMQGYLMSKKLWTKLKKIRPKPGEVRGKAEYTKRLEDESLEEANVEIIGKISENVNHCFRVTVLKMEYADEVWDYFQRLYKPETEIGANGVISKKKFYAMQLGEGENISNFLAEVYGHAKDLKIPDNEVREFIIQGALPESFTTWIDSIKDNVAYSKWPEFRAKIEKEGLLKGFIREKNKTGNVNTIRSVQETSRFSGKCYKCGKEGHMASECSGEIVCFKCKKTGHKSNNCYQNRGEKKEFKKRSDKQVRELKFVIELTKESRDNRREISREESRQENKEESQEETEIVEWKYDTACSDNCTPRRDLFATYEHCNDEFHTAKKGHTMKIIGRGTVQFKSPGGIVELTEVLHCEELSSNLLSGFSIQNKGVKVSIGEEIILTKEGITICKGLLQDRAWVVNLEILKQTKSVVEETVLASNHRRLGHIGKTKEKEFCEICMKAKATAIKKGRKSVNRKPTRGVVHMDLFGPIYHYYFALVIYDYTDEVAILKLKKKSDFYESWAELAKMWKNQYETPIKLIKCDGGGEFINKRMESWCKENGCDMFVRNPYVKWQIGVAERRIRTVVEMANCMLMDSCLPAENYFIDALLTAVYLLNRQVSSFTGKIPAEQRTGRIVDTSLLRVWGCRAFALIQKERRKGKFGEKAEEGILVGYTNSGYIIELKDGRRIASRDVRFDERRDSNQESSDEESDEESSDDSDNEEKEDNEKSFYLLAEDEEEPQDENHDEHNLEQELDSRLEMEAKRGSISKENIVTGKRDRKHIAYEVYKTLSMKNALSTPEKEEWVKAVETEYSQYCQAEMFKECSLPSGRKAISTRLLMNRKADGRFRPRLVARGYEQKEGIDYKEVFAPVANYSVFRFGIALAAHYGLKARTFDVTAAFAQSKMDEEIYIAIPEGYTEYGRKYMKKRDLVPKINESTALLLRKTLQGVKQGAKNWYEEFKGKMKSLGLEVSEYEPCLFYKILNAIPIILILWVDDYMWIAPDSIPANEILERVKAAYKTRETHGVLLGMNISNREDGIFICSRDYIERKCMEFGINENSIPCRQPMDVNLQLVKAAICTGDPYLEIIGSLIHAVNTTRSDVAFSVGVLARFGNCYDEKHQEAAKRVLRYLHTTRDKGIFYGYQEGGKKKLSFIAMQTLQVTIIVENRLLE